MNHLSFFSFLCIVFLLTGYAQDLRIAVLEFQNNSGKQEDEPLKMGIRDMLTTDIQKVSAISLVERARLDEVRKEIDMEQTKYFDAQQTVELGKLLGATHILTGAYLIDKNTMRIDVRLVDVSTGMIVYTNKVDGPKEDFFDLEKLLASKIVETMYPEVSSKELRRVNQIQTEEFANFDIYSKAVYEEEQGNLGEAIKLLQGVVSDENFKMAREKLALYQQMLEKSIEEMATAEQEKQKTLSGQMDQEFKNALAILQTHSHSADYYASYIVAAVHYGLRGDEKKEAETLISYWKEFSMESKPYEIFQKMMKKVNSNSLKWEKLLMQIEEWKAFENKDDMNVQCEFTDEASNLYYYPKFVNVWPFNLSEDTLTDKDKEDNPFTIELELFVFNVGPTLKERRNISFERTLPHTFFDNSELLGKDMADRSSGLPVQKRDIYDFNNDNGLIELWSSAIVFYSRNKQFKIENFRLESLFEHLYHAIKSRVSERQFNGEAFNPQGFTVESATQVLQAIKMLLATEKDKKHIKILSQYQLDLVKWLKEQNGK